VSKQSSKEQIQNQKTVGASELEAQATVKALYMLSLDPEVGLADKGTATRLARELQGLPGAMPRREDLMIRSQTFVARI
jgi:hypothetical protein